MKLTDIFFFAVRLSGAAGRFKRMRWVLPAAVSAMMMTSCSQGNQKGEKVIVVRKADIVQETIGVNGMTCVGCEVTLEERLSEVTGVVDVKASHTQKKVSVAFDSTKTNIKAITKAIKEAGYQLITP